ncbi:hypothetical protein HYH03_005546 [Edaphochlamys debaryana]|uniref:Protein MCM10 homolog n=1 Tax=Edaphochlamys debaryana TaxID=47281 RepID=A0A835Y7R5_9CHLO|nr:hypothetical protein HYH03_005546 [Edaphochlamys debaryana]|eukprot:KAG2496313.1 hypothetical protein HYH03_005546 [Edaphochlamys debaryana]
MEGDDELDLLMALAEEADEEEPVAKSTLAPARAAASAPPAPPKKSIPPPAPAQLALRQPAPHSNQTPSLLQSALLRADPASRQAPVASILPAAKAPGSGRQVSDGYVEPHSGFRISKPAISSMVLRERLSDDCVFLALKDITPTKELTGRWATMGILVAKVQATGRNGESYSRWTLSDLGGKQLTLFLWRKAAQEHYKEAEGSVLLLWSPQVRKDEGGGGGNGPGLSLHVDKPELLQRPGMSPDFGFCRGIKKDGQRCTFPVNKTTCEYCPYHAQAALRALSSNRSDIAGANLMQRQLLPQARAAQKQMVGVYGHAPLGINSLITRPMAPGGAKPPGAPAASASAAGAAAGAGAKPAARVISTGAYGSAADYEPDTSAAGPAGGGGGKRSYGAALLASIQEREALEAAGGDPSAKRPRSEVFGAAAAKARAVVAARQAGQLASQQALRRGGAGGAGPGPGSSTPVPAAASAAAGAAASKAAPSSAPAAARPSLVLSAGPKLRPPPPLSPALAALLKPPAAAAEAKAGPGVPAGGSKGTGAGTGTGTGSAAATTAPQGPAAQASGDPAVGEDDDLILFDEEEAGGQGAEPQPAAAKPGPSSRQPQPPSKQEQQPKPQGAAPTAAAGAAKSAPPKAGTSSAAKGADGGAAGDGGSGGGDDEESCGLDELLELFPDAENEAPAPQQHNAQAQAQTDADGARAAQQPPAPLPRAGGGAAAARAPAVGPSAAPGLLPRVPGLNVAPAVKAADAKKQQAAAAKARAEKLKTLGMAPKPAAPDLTPKPLGASNALPGARGASSSTAAAAALAKAKGLPLVPAARAKALQAQQAAVQYGGAAAGGGGGGGSAMAAAFGALVQTIPEKAVESRYQELSEDAAGDAVLSMLESLEARDALVQQLDSVTHLKVTAWHCAQCDRLSEYMDKQCRADGHTFSKTQVLKRFWTCDHCNARVTTLGVRFPASRCSRCNNPSLEFTAATMYRGPRELKPAGTSGGLACKENLFATIESHPEIGKRTFR